MLFGEFAKSAAEAEYPELWRGLVGAWSPCLNPRGGTVLRDLSGRGNHGTLTNMDAATDWVMSGGKTALDFDGLNDYVSFGSSVVNTLINGATAVMLSMWVRYATLDALQYSNKLFCGRIGNATLANVWMNIRGDGGNAGKILFGGRSRPTDGFQERSSTAVLSANNWYHIVGILDFARDAIYTAINGVIEAPTSVTFGNSIYSEANFSSVYIDSIGEQNASAGVPPNASIDDVSLRTTASKSVVVDLWELGRGGWATPRRRRWNYATAQTAIPYWVFARKNARLIGGGVT